MTCTHEFIVLDVQEDQLWPKMGALRGLDDLGDVDTRHEELEMLHDCSSNQCLVQYIAMGYSRFSGLYLL